jgi:Mg2+-importing ATPase
MHADRPARKEDGAPDEAPWWSAELAALGAQLGSGAQGLDAAEATARLARDGANEMRTEQRERRLRLLARQWASPLVLVLAGGAAVSLFLGDIVDALAILVIVLGSTGLGYLQEARASEAMARLRSRLALTARVRRGGVFAQVPARELVEGDVIELSAGALVPADGRVLEARDFLVTEASLTGESMPVEKRPGTAPADAPLAARRGCVFLGSSVRSGSATVMVARTGARTVMGGIGARLQQPPPETEFARGVRRFGELLLRVMLLVVLLVIAANQALGRPFIDSLLFAVALAVGLSPELLPAVVSVSLARGARRLAESGVLVRRAEAIEDLGGMDVLCTDKTGTLTVGSMSLADAYDLAGRPSAEVLRLAWLNARFETGIDNPLDAALVAAGRDAGLDAAGWTKLDEIPYDFVRKRLTIVLADGDAQPLMITKGAVAQVIAVCDAVDEGGSAQPLDEAARARLEDFVREQGERGVRVLALASARVAPRADFTSADERALVLRGFLCFADPPRHDAEETVRDLASRGIAVKIVTGDNRHVAAHVAREVGLDGGALLTGPELATMHDEALWHLAERTDVFAELDPAQKERIVRALQHRGHAVGYLGDGINDAPALHAADVGISVDGAVDVARESADIVLLQPDLGVLRRGVEQGRRTFANTLKYIQITISANFGNMISMALATPLLPFMPLTATQILLNNFLSDLPSMAISADRVDSGALDRAQRWDVAAVRRFMIVFGLVSSVFDLLAFWVLLRVFGADEKTFHTAWFIVSVLTELAVVMVLRTTQAAWRSRPAPLLAALTVAVAAAALALPWLAPLATPLGLVPLPAPLLAGLLGIVGAYVVTTEVVKRWLAAR